MLNVPRQVLQVCEGRGVISRERGGKGEGAVNMNIEQNEVSRPVL